MSVCEGEILMKTKPTSLLDILAKLYTSFRYVHSSRRQFKKGNLKMNGLKRMNYTLKCINKEQFCI